MTEETSAVTHLSVVMTTDQGEMSQTTGETGVTSSSSSGAALYYFECFVVVIGIIGAAANGLILYALVASKQHNKHELIVNRNALDLYSCIFLVITYGMKLCNLHLTGSLGHWLCMFILSENLLWSGLCGSFVNLTLIAIERYLKVVHAIWSKNKLRKRMIYAAMACAWIIGFVQLLAGFLTSAVVDGICFGYSFWKKPQYKMAYGIFFFVSTYIIVIAIFIFCYGKILMAIRRQARVMAGHSAAGPSIAQIQAHQIQTNVIKTMILVCAFYAIAWLPENIYFLLICLDRNLSLMDNAYYTTMFIAFLYICTTRSTIEFL